MQLVLAYAGMRPGGVTVDVRNLADGLKQRGNTVAAVGSLRELERELARLPEALVHVFGCLPSYTTFSAMALAKRRRRPLVWTPVFHPNRPRSWAGYGFLRVMQAFDMVAPRVARFSDAVIAATAAEAEHFEALGAPTVRLIPPGVDRLVGRMDARERAAFRRRFGLTDGPLVLTVARANSRKGLPFGLAAFQALRRQVPQAQLLLVGVDADHAAGSVDGVTCVGWLEPADVAGAYGTADLLFVSSLYEGLPRAVIEAWSHGLAVAVTDRIALAPLVRQGAGCVVDYGAVEETAARLAWMLRQPEVLIGYGQQGMRLIEEQFLLEDITRRTEALYGELVAR